jgi:hypothetical protein
MPDNKNLLLQTLLTGFQAWVEVSNSSEFLEFEALHSQGQIEG